MSYQIQAPPDIPEYAIGAWISCLSWALGNDGIRGEFEKETGIKYSPARCAMDLLVDDATGWREGYMKVFVPWFNANIWGKWDEVIELEKPL